MGFGSIEIVWLPLEQLSDSSGPDEEEMNDSSDRHWSPDDDNDDNNDS